MDASPPHHRSTHAQAPAAQRRCHHSSTVSDRISLSVRRIGHTKIRSIRGAASPATQMGD